MAPTADQEDLVALRMAVDEVIQSVHALRLELDELEQLEGEAHRPRVEEIDGEWALIDGEEMPLTGKDEILLREAALTWLGEVEDQLSAELRWLDMEDLGLE